MGDGINIRSILGALKAGVLSTACAVAIGTGCAFGGSVVETNDDSDGSQTGVVATLAPAEDIVNQGRALGSIWIKNDAVTNLDPTQFDSRQSFPYKDVYSGLTRLDPINGEVEPDLVSMWQLSDDGLSYSFRIRDDLRFSDGSRVDPADVHFSWARALSPELSSQWSRSVLGNIVGAADVMAGESTELSGFAVVDEQNFTVELTKPNTEWLHLLTHPVASVLSKSNVEQWERRWTFPLESQEANSEYMPGSYVLPVGTGRFRVAGFEFWQNSVWMVPNELHWSGETPTTCIALLDDTVVTHLGTRLGVTDLDVISVDAESRVAYRLGDDGDAVTVDAGSLEGYKEVVWDSLPRVAFMAINASVPPFDELEFRRALQASADVSRLPYRYSTLTPGDRPTGLIPPSFRGYVDRDFARLDFQTARGFLNQSTYAELISDHAIRFYVVDDFSPEDYRIMTRYWSEWLGLSTSTHGFTLTSFGYFEDPEGRDELNARLYDGTLQLRFIEVDPGWLSPLAVFEALRNAFGPNASSVELTVLGDMLDAAVAELDSVKRSLLYTEIEQHIMDRALAIPISWGRTTNVVLVREWIDGYEPSPYAPLSLGGVTVDTTHPDYPADRPCN